MTNPGDAQRSFLPRLHLDVLDARRGPAVQPSEAPRAAAVLFVDVSGFTRLADQLATRGSIGAEHLSSVINALFGRMTRVVREHGGDVLLFAGDAMWAAWPAQADPEVTLADATMLAVQSAVAIQGGFAEGDAAPEFRLSLRATVSAGSLILSELGGFAGAWRFLVGGPPIMEAALADKLGRPGDVVLTPSAYAIIADRCEGVRLGDEAVRLTKVVREVRLASAPPTPPPAAEVDLTGHVPHIVIERVAAGQTEWLPEFRHLTVSFVNLANIVVGAPDALARLQPAFAAVQSVLARLEGTIYQFLVDEKGVTLVTAFGLPPFVHEDDALRAVRSSLAIHEALSEHGVEGSIGVTTGRVFCALYGDDRRRQYALVGSTVNLAARLMQAARGEVVCDKETRLAARSHAGLRFKELAPIRAKGIDAPVACYRPERVTERESAPESEPPMVGRHGERAAVTDALAALHRGEGGCLVLEGEAGVGKSRLAAHVLAEARAAGIGCLRGRGEAIESGSHYHAFRGVFAELLGLTAAVDAEGLEREVRARLEGHPELARLTPLLSAVLPFQLADNDDTAAMAAEPRGASTCDLLVASVRALAPARVVLLLEDAHWFDSASWALVAALSHQRLPILIVVTTRPMEPELPALKRILEAAGTHRLKLEGLSEGEALELVLRHLGARALPVPVASFLRERAAGNPLFSVELLGALRDHGLLRVEDGDCFVPIEIEDPVQRFDDLLVARGLPTTLAGVATSRIDRLSAEQQIALKTASVIGRAFSRAALAGVHPLPEARERLAACLDELRHLGVLSLQPTEREPTYAFCHVITQEAAYGTMPFAQRRDLHGRVGEWIERHSAPIQAHHWPLLAHHFHRAEDAPKAARYYAEAGAYALRHHANEESVRFYTEALAHDGRGAPRVAPEVRGAWELQLGRAYVSWSRFAESRAHLEGGLALARQPVPRGALSALWNLLAEVVRQFGHRRDPGRHVGRLAARRGELLDAARAYEGLMETYFFLGATLPCLYAAMRSLNLAELAGPSEELARSYAAVGAIAGFVPAHGLAEAYCERAFEVARRVGDPGALAWVDTSVGVYRAGVGDFDAAHRLFEESAAIADRLGDRRRWEDSVQSLAAVSYLQGRLDESLQRAESFRLSAVRRSDFASQAESARRCVYCLLMQGRLQDAAPVVKELQSARRRAALKPGAGQNPDMHAATALYHLRRGADDEAVAAADEALRVINASSPTFYDLTVDYAAVAEVYLTLRSRSSGDPVRAQKLRRAGRQICKRLREQARTFPIAAATSSLWDGVDAWCDGRQRAAHAAWQKSADAAAALRMPFDEGLAWLAIAEHSAPGGSNVAPLARATDLLLTRGAAAYAARIEAAASGAPRAPLRSAAYG